MSSISDSSACVPNGNSERNGHCCIREQELQRRLFYDRLRGLITAIDKKMVEGAQKTESISSLACICRVPEQLRMLKESAYTPRFVSIGPLHSKDQHILKSPVQDVKKSYANSLFDRVSNGSEALRATVLTVCVGQMRESLDDAKKYYAEEVEEVMDEEMLVIDGCFVLELLYRVHHMQNNSTDPILSSNLMTFSITHDLILLENQLPFFVLHKLFNLTVARIVGNDPISLHEYIISCFSSMWTTEKNGATPPPPPPAAQENNYQHILHILHHHYHHEHAVETLDEHSEFMPCASDLESAGVEFVVGTKVRFVKPESPLMFKFFRRARFEIPTLPLYDFTEPLLRNLIAFEQCCHGGVVVKHYFTSYANFMATLISSSEDVRVLEKAKIIQKNLGASEDASHLFNNLCKGFVPEEFYFNETINAAAEYSKRCWPDAMTHLKRNYLASPWTTIAFCAAFITFGVAMFKFVRNDFR